MPKSKKWLLATGAATVSALAFLLGQQLLAQQPPRPPPFPEASVDYFQEMDGGVQLTEAEARGRNTWMIWTGGNDAFWDYIGRHSFGNMDLLKVLDSRNRDRRFAHYGLVNEPGFRRAAQPDEHGIWLDEPNGTRDPAFAPDAYRESFPRADFVRIYGRATGVLGARLFPNPDFAEAARRRWDPVRYYQDPDYDREPNLVRP